MVKRLITCLWLGAICSTASAEAIPSSIEKYGSVDEAILHQGELTPDEQAELRKYVVDLEYQRLQSLYSEQEKLEQLQVKNKQKDVINQAEITNDPEMIRKLRELQLKAQIAQNQLLIHPPKSLIDTISFDPSLPQEMILKVFPGFPGAISFFDSTGAPWPIVKVKQGSNGAFNSEKMPGNSYSLEAAQFGVSNTGWFILEGLDTVIPFRISSENPDYFNTRRQVIIPMHGPNATAPTVSGKMSQQDQVVMDKAGPEVFAFITGTTKGIDGAKETNLQGITGQAYIYNDFVYIRTTAVLRGKGSSLVEEATLGDFHLYKLYKRAFYWFFTGNQKVKAFVSYE